MKNKTAIIITTFERDELLFKSVQSIKPYLNENLILIIVDQNHRAYNYTINLYYHGIAIPYDSGLSYSRNIGVQKAKELGCEYIVIASDSMIFNETISYVNILTQKNLIAYDLIGFELHGTICDWEAKMELIPGNSFQLTFIDKKEPNYILEPNIELYDCDIVRNFFIANIYSLNKSPWNPYLKLCEHEVFFHEFKENGYYVGWTDLIHATKLPDRPENYYKLREKNFREGQELVKKLYNIKSWVSYANKPTGVK